MWFCFRCALRLVRGDKDKLKNIFVPSLDRGTCDKCKKKNISVDFISEIDVNHLEVK